MNERIKKLHDQAFAETTDYYATIQRFSELIVRECADLIMDNEIDYPITGAVYDGDQAKAIMKHFGVK